MPRYGAIDIGSNSVRMQAADVLPDGQTKVLAADREVTRLGQSVFRGGIIDRAALDNVSAVLARMSAEFRRLDVVASRVVATSAVRDASNQATFLQRASQAAGSPVEVISGREEARLIHLGVQAQWQLPRKRFLIVDIGGGSAEIIASDGGQLLDAVSKPLGAIRLWETFLRSDPPSKNELARMHGYIDDKLAGLAEKFGGGWDDAVGTSATAGAVVSAVNDIPRSKRDQADHMQAKIGAIKKLYAELCDSDAKTRAKMTGIGPRRAELIVAGAGTLLRILQLFNVSSLYYSTAGVRDGIIADLAARGIASKLGQLDADAKRELEETAKRYGVSLAHVRKVATLSATLFAQLEALHKLPPAAGKLLQAAAYLHDVGHYVSDGSHHKHSHYLVANSDLTGFTARERLIVAVLCRYHRKALPSATHPEFQALSLEDQQTVRALIPLLRLADNFDRGHRQGVQIEGSTIQPGVVTIRLNRNADPEIEAWAADRAGLAFREIYGVNLAFERSGEERVPVSRTGS